MGVEAAIVGIFTSVGFTFSAASSIASGIISSVLSVGLSLAAKALSGKPKVEGRQGRNGNIRSASAPHEVALGRVRKGGVMAYITGTGVKNRLMHHVLMVAAHSIDGFEKVHVGGKETQLEASGNASNDPGNPNKLLHDYYAAEFAEGTDDQVANANLVSRTAGAPGEWTTAHRLRGVAYIYSLLRSSPERYPNFIPSITTTIRGANTIFDPRDDSTGWSQNPALQCAWLLETYVNIPRSRIDTTALIAAANVCDEVVTLKSGGTEPRYHSDGFFELDGNPESWLIPIAEAMAGAVIEHDGTYYIHAGAWRAPEVTISDDDVVDGGSIAIITAESNLVRANRVQGLFVGEESNGQPTEYPLVKDAAMLAEDNGIELKLDHDLEFVASHTQAQRVGRIVLNRQRSDETVKLDVPLWIGLDVKPWDNVTLEIESLGLSGTWVINEHTFIVKEEGPLAWVKLELQRHASSVYDYDAATQEEALSSTSPNIPNDGAEPAMGLGSGGDQDPPTLGVDSDEGHVGDVVIDWASGDAFRKNPFKPGS